MDIMYNFFYFVKWYWTYCVIIILNQVEILITKLKSLSSSKLLVPLNTSSAPNKMLPNHHFTGNNKFEVIQIAGHTILLP